MALSIMTLGIMTLGIMTLSIITLSIMTLSIMTLGMALSIVILITMTQGLKNLDTQHNNTWPLVLFC